MILPTSISKFSLRAIFFFGIAFLPFTVYMLTVPDETTDPYYYKVASSQQSSLIIGASRGANGLRPDLLNASGLNFEGPMFNYAFENVVTPYAESYFSAIRNKVNPRTKNGLFIVDVNPYGVSKRVAQPGEDQKNHFSETSQFLDNMWLTNIRPNPEYFIRRYPYPFYHILTRKIKGRPMFIGHKDGWIEQKIAPRTGAAMAEGNLPIDEATADLKKYKTPSEERIQYLEQIISFLQQHGKVVLVRMPINGYWANLENAYWPDFDERMTTIARDKDIPYVNLLKQCPDCKYFDGHHLMGSEAEGITKSLIDALKKEGF